MLRIMAVSFLGLFAASGLLRAGEPIDKETIAAYEKLGAIYGGITPNVWGLLRPVEIYSRRRGGDEGVAGV